MRIALLANGLHPYRVGGMQKHSTMLARRLPASGAAVDVYYARDAEPDDARVHAELFGGDPDVSVRPVAYGPLPRVPGHYYADCWRVSRALWRAVIASGAPYDFVYGQGYTGWYAVHARRRAGDGAGPPVGVHAHGIEALQERWTPWRLVRHAFAPVWQRDVIRLADVNLSLGGRMDDVIKEAGGDPATILPAHNGVDQAWLRPLDDVGERVNDGTRFLFVGRDSDRKGFPELNSAIGQLKGDGRFAIDIVGPVAEARRVAHPAVTYHGVVRDEDRLRAIYRGCDVLVCPSYSEGMPTVILEAMASGLAVLASDVGAVRLVVDEESGWLIGPRDAEALAVAMRRAMDEPLAEKRLAGRRRVEAHTWPAVTARFVDALRGYLQRAESPASQGAVA